MTDQKGFVSLTSLRGQTVDPARALAEIRQIYFKTTRQTIDNDFAHAIELLKSLATEEEREKATVYMEGIAQLRNEWAPKKGAKGAKVRGAKARKP
jgi:hypothetical protein